jgi:hypothetical protein
VLNQWILRMLDYSEAPIHLGFDGQFVQDTFAFSPDGSSIGWGTFDGTVFLAEISAVRRRLATLRR